MALNLIHFLGCRFDWISGHLCSHTYVYILILFGLYLGISVAMAFVIRSNFHHPAISKGKTTEKLCALTFDDGPDPENTPAILETLGRQKVPATFFVIGRNLEGNELILRDLDAGGHLIGNHSWSHANWFDFFSPHRMRRELIRTAEAIAGTIGKSPLLFRPPYGVINPMLNKALKGLGYHVIGWNIRTFDTVNPEPEKISQNVLRKLSPGSIILLHDHVAGAPGLTDHLIRLLKSNGYRIVPLTQLTQTESYA